MLARIRLGGIFLTLLAGSPAFAQTPLSSPAGNVARGKIVFLECQACHAAAPGGPTLVGPSLVGVYGRKAASLAGYDYSPALKASGLVWNSPNLNLWLTDPSKLVPGTKMAFTGIASPDLRADVIAYLATLK